MGEPPDPRRQRLHELAQIQKQRPLTADEYREIARLYRALGDRLRAGQAEATAYRLEAAARRTEEPSLWPEIPPPSQPLPQWSPLEAAEAPRGPAPPVSGWAILSLLCGLLGWLLVTAVVGLVSGFVALARIGRSEGRVGGQGIAVAGLCLSALWCVFLPILAAILFPAFAKARERASQSYCLSNEKQIALAMLMYAQDYDERLPRANAEWTDLLTPYLQNVQVFVCPAGGDRGYGYAYHDALRGKSLRAILHPSATVALYESADRHSPHFPHHEGANLAYVDGHVSWRQQYEAADQIHTTDSWAPETPSEQPPDSR